VAASDCGLLGEVGEGVDAHGLVGAGGCDYGEVRVRLAGPGAGVGGRSEGCQWGDGGWHLFFFSLLAVGAEAIDRDVYFEAVCCKATAQDNDIGSGLVVAIIGMFLCCL
jgi:hypothetical protein